MCSKWEMPRRATTCPFPKTQHFSSKFTSSSLIPPRSSRLNDGTAAPPDNQLPHPHPHLTHHWWKRRVAREICDTFIRKRNGITCELRMEVTLMEEVGVDQRHHKRVAEHKRAEENTREDDQFGDGHDTHGSVVVSFDPKVKLLRQGMRLRWSSSSERWTGRQELRHQGRTSKRECMEKGKHKVGKQCEGDRPGSPPEDSQQKVLNVLIREGLSDIRHVRLGSPKRLLANNEIGH